MMVIKLGQTFKVGDKVAFEYGGSVYSGTVQSTGRYGYNIISDSNLDSEGRTVFVTGINIKLLEDFLSADDYVKQYAMGKDGAYMFRYGNVMDVDRSFALVEFDTDNEFVPVYDLELVPIIGEVISRARILPFNIDGYIDSGDDQLVHGLILGNFKEAHIGNYRALQKLYINADVYHIGILVGDDGIDVRGEKVRFDMAKYMVKELMAGVEDERINISFLNPLYQPPAKLFQCSVGVEGEWDTRLTDYCSRWIDDIKIIKVKNVMTDKHGRLSSKLVEDGIVNGYGDEKGD